MKIFWTWEPIAFLAIFTYKPRNLRRRSAMKKISLTKRRRKEGKEFQLLVENRSTEKNKNLLLDNSMIFEWVMTSISMYGNDGKKSISWHYAEQRRFTFEIAKINLINFYGRLLNQYQFVPLLVALKWAWELWVKQQHLSKM